MEDISKEDRRKVYYQRARSAKVLLRIRENPKYERPAGRGDAFKRHYLWNRKPDRKAPSLLLCMKPMPNHISTYCGTRRVPPGGCHKIFCLLFLGNGWADSAEICIRLGSH